MSEHTQTVLFGACDRHNLGDLLFPHIAAALLPESRLRFAGLLTRDLRSFGGHLVSGIADIARLAGSNPVNVVHVGGETLTCEAWEAALMLLDEEQSIARVMRGAHSAKGWRRAWAADTLGNGRRAPYVLPKSHFAAPGIFVHNGVGGVAFESRDSGMRAEVIDALRSADFVGVRDHVTQGVLRACDIAATLMPDPGVMTMELFKGRIWRHRAQAEVVQACNRFPGGFCAVQFSADFADDASLALLAGELDKIVRTTKLGIVLFRAGAAPLHDSLALYRRVQERMAAKQDSALFESLNIWDICALIGASRGFVGSSLHGRILASACGLPRVTLAPSSVGNGASTKHAAYIETWEDGAMPGAIALSQLAEAFRAALAANPAHSVQRARDLVRLYTNACRTWLDMVRDGKG